jgi:hypothetical protein
MLNNREIGVTTKTTGATVRTLLKVFVGLLLWTGLLVAATFWINPVLGTITAIFAAFVWTFGIAPRLAGQMVAALILYFREKRHSS